VLSYAGRRQTGGLGPALPQEQVPVLATPQPPSRPALSLPIMAPAARKCDRGRDNCAASPKVAQSFAAF
jgi:hypothetical protein